MRYLLECSPTRLAELQVLYPTVILGQLHTTIRKANAGGVFAIGSGVFTTGVLVRASFAATLAKHEPWKALCLFVAMPDVFMRGRRTLELYAWRDEFAPGWPHALCAQDGIENFDIPWGDMQALVVGGSEKWHGSEACDDVITTALTLGKHVHVSRVYTPNGFEHFHSLGCDTCDATSVLHNPDRLRDMADVLARQEEWRLPVEENDPEDHHELA
jgi:hypothetical protein